MKQLGYHPFPQPPAILSREYQGSARVQLLRFLHHRLWLLEQLEVEHARHLDRRGREHRQARDPPRLPVMEIMTDSDGRSAGVKYLDSNGKMHEQPARFVILGTYVFENNRLLLLSKSKAYPKGLRTTTARSASITRAQVTVGVNGVFQART